MRTAFLLVWLAVPAAVGAYHYGPGQARLALDEADRLLAAAEEDVAAWDWSAAVKKYDAALALLPPERADVARRVRLARAKAQMSGKDLPGGYDELTTLLADLSAEPQADPRLLKQTRESLASAQYYLTWLMRLEGKPRDEWEPQIEAARQNYRLLAEGAGESGQDADLERHSQDLEAAIRLARMDLADLQALPLPSQCQGCCSNNCKKKGQCKKPGKNPNHGENDARGAGSGPPPDNQGS
ncbi:MAG: hypothetical protein KF708_18555 [Pirellulales bacterium]|nr:hypothetical protein [Pirellulales bacterium]